MCRRADCSKCGRPTYAGCGAHVEQVLADVPRAERCHCRESKAKQAAAKPEVRNEPRSWLRELLGSETPPAT
jgi:hypothetical protein